MKYVLERIAVAALPDCPEWDQAGIAVAAELRATSEPPPIVVCRSFLLRGGKREPQYAVYDGLRRIVAARRCQADTLLAAVCATACAAEGLRGRIQEAGGAVKFWELELASSLKPQASSR